MCRISVFVKFLAIYLEYYSSDITYLDDMLVYLAMQSIHNDWMKYSYLRLLLDIS